ncbi:hypothetical protein CcrColossus_gp058 [Caulobacter phage CcrColossus]|uniref:Uncharacterized protein n=1 Tax=Caulobacter phage CcrColossus TaxID=1211640 RepID=K4JVQ2_9CAUD|nr:hypothetical protein CcrColossus_gp058 [Caulobacter phage CcrColossus]AFU87928.1 hypothetical protein CcrColossus_gp058 [Caulobacter phage CcrColossus]
MMTVPWDPRAKPKRVGDEREFLSSREYIAEFERRDRTPEPEGTPEREEQIVRIAKRILPGALRKASRDQVLTQHRLFMSGVM